MKKTILLAAAVAALAAMAMVSLTMSACEVSTANISDIKICDDMSGDQCTADKSAIPAAAPAIYCSGQLDNAPEGTTVKITWRYLPDDIDIDSVTLTADKSGGGPFSSSLTKPEGNWPAGKYEVVLDLGTDNSEPVHKQFEVI